MKKTTLAGFSTYAILQDSKGAISVRDLHSGKKLEVIKAASLKDNKPSADSYGLFKDILDTAGTVTGRAEARSFVAVTKLEAYVASAVMVDAPEFESKIVEGSALAKAQEVKKTKAELNAKKEAATKAYMTEITANPTSDKLPALLSALQDALTEYEKFEASRGEKAVKSEYVPTQDEQKILDEHTALKGAVETATAALKAFVTEDVKALLSKCGKSSGGERGEVVSIDLAQANIIRKLYFEGGEYNGATFEKGALGAIAKAFNKPTASLGHIISFRQHLLEKGDALAQYMPKDMLNAYSDGVIINLPENLKGIITEGTRSQASKTAMPGKSAAVNYWYCYKIPA